MMLYEVIHPSKEQRKLWKKITSENSCFLYFKKVTFSVLVNFKLKIFPSNLFAVQRLLAIKTRFMTRLDKNSTTVVSSGFSAI